MTKKLWWVVRYCAVRMRKTIDSLAPSITTILVRGKRLTIGMAASDGASGTTVCDATLDQEIHISKPVAPSEIVKYMYDREHKFHPLAAVMQQEVLVAAANLISAQPQLFVGILTVRIAWLIEGMQLLLQYG